MAKAVFDVTRRSWTRFTQLYVRCKPLHAPLNINDRRDISLAMIEAANGWQQFMRRYYLVSAQGGYLSDGTRISGNLSASVDDALGSAVWAFKPTASRPAAGWTHRDEPDWLDPVITFRALNNLSLSNSSGFATAMSAGSGSHQFLTTCRNFVAHRNAGTALKVRSLVRKQGVLSRANPEELPSLPGAGRPQSLLADWLDELIAIVELVPQ